MSTVIRATLLAGVLAATAPADAVQTVAPGAVQSVDPGQRSAETGAIGGIVRHERHQFARAQVQAFPVDGISSFPQAPGAAAFMRPSGSAQADSDGRFRIANLPPGAYLVAAYVSSIADVTQTDVYVPTFYPSVADQGSAMPVLVSAGSEARVTIDVVRARAARIAGIVTHESGRPVEGTRVGLSWRFGGFGTGTPVGVVGADGRFESRGLAPGWYRVTADIGGDRPDASRAEYAETIIEVGDRDLENVPLVIRRSASITGRVVAGPETTARDGLLRVTASRSDPWLEILYPSTLTQSGGAFALDAPPGHYVFSVRSERPPNVEVQQVTIDGFDGPLSGVDISSGRHEVTLAVGLRLVTSPAPTPAAPLSSSQLLEEFLERPTLQAATQLAARGDVSVLPRLVALLKHDDRHIRGNAAVVFAAVGDDRGFETISAILHDRSDRPPGQGQAGGSSDGAYHVEAQIRADRYYAAHLLGDIRDARGVPLLVAVIDDRDVNAVVPWSLGQIGGSAAVAALIEMLGHRDPATRVSAIYALETLGAREALPRLEALADDMSRSNSGNQVTVGTAARAAIATLRGEISR
jgi:hypothetical protein